METGKKNPLDLNYNKLFSKKDNYHESIVVPATQKPSSSSSSSPSAQDFKDLCKTFSENEIKGRISRIKATLVTLEHCFPGTGAPKLKGYLKTLEEEQERRHDHQIGIINKENSVGIMVWENLKKQKYLHTSNVGVREDKISYLPDELIHHILSFLPTKCAMSTCILSKRWKYVAKSIPILDFRNWRSDAIENKDLETRRFIYFLNTILYLHEKPNIQKFCLSGDYVLGVFQVVYEWISIVIKHKVKELFLSGGFRTPFTFPLSFFTCDSLTVLDLESVILNVPDTVFFPRVKLLRLTSINFVDGMSTKKLLSNCPILEELCLINCGGLKSETVCISNLALKNLHIRSCNFRESTMNICTPNLITISYSGELPEDFVFDSFLSLVEADIHLYNLQAFSAKTFVLIKLFEALSNVRLLKICGLAFQQVLSHFTGVVAFNNLIRQEVSSPFDYPTFGLESVSVLRTLFRFLQLSPNIETIVFAENMYLYCRSGKENEEYCWSPEPKCQLLHLRSVKFSNFYGMPAELEAIKLFLKCAVILERMTIVASLHLCTNGRAQTKAIWQLHSFPKPMNCVIDFLPYTENI